MEDLRGLKRGHVEIAVIDALARGAIPKMVRHLRDDYPGITVGLRVLDNIHVAEAVRSGAVDLGLLLDPRFSRDLTVRAHAEVALGFVTPPAIPCTTPKANALPPHRVRSWSPQPRRWLWPPRSRRWRV
jgi:DNA-binding transcriptional LysR family regulator